MARVTDTQLIILSAASQREDRGVELPANLKGEAARKVVDKLIRAGLLEEVRAGGSLPVWRRDDDSGAMALRMTESGLEAIGIEDVTVAAPKETSVRPAPAGGEAETPAPKAVAARKRISVATPKSTRKKHHPRRSRTSKHSWPSSKRKPWIPSRPLAASCFYEKGDVVPTHRIVAANAGMRCMYADPC